jgi:hypothetical protein
MKINHRVLANVSVADSSSITKAWELSNDRSDPYLFNHSVRSWLFAAQIAEQGPGVRRGSRGHRVLAARHRPDERIRRAQSF